MIGEDAFNGCKKLTNPPIRNTLLHIGDRAFSECEANTLTEIDISNAKYVGEGAFKKCCNRVTKMTLPFVGVEACDESSRAGLPSFSILNDDYKKVLGIIFGYEKTTNSSVTFDDTTFQHEYTSTRYHYYIPNSLKHVIVNSGDISPDAFDECKYLESVTILDTKNIMSTFSNCTNLRKISIPDSVEYISDRAFTTCSNLEYYEDSEFSLKYLGNETHNNVYAVEYFGAKDINKISISETCRCIRGALFKDFTKLTDITINNINNIHWIGRETFNGCELLENIGPNGSSGVYISNSLKRIKNSLFLNCSSITNIIFEDQSRITEIEENSFKNCIKLASVNLPESLETIRQKAFYNCRELTTINLSASVSSISNRSFALCRKLSSITVGDNNSTYISFDGNLYKKDYSILYKCPEGKTNITIHTNCKTISSCSLENTNIETLIIPNNIETIEDGAIFYTFSEDKPTNIALKNIELPFLGNTKYDGTTKKYFNNSSAFSQLSLDSIEVRDTEDIASLNSRQDTIFEYIDFNKITLHAGCGGENTQYPAYLPIFDGVTSETIIVDDSRITKNYEGTFINLDTKLLDISGTSITDVNYFNFSEKTDEMPYETTICLPKNITNIGKNAFSGKITSVTDEPNRLKSGKLKDLYIYNANDELTIHAGAFSDIPFETVYINSFSKIGVAILNNSVTDLTIPFIGWDIAHTEINWIGSTYQSKNPFYSRQIYNYRRN